MKLKSLFFLFFVLISLNIFAQNTEKRAVNLVFVNTVATPYLKNIFYTNSAYYERLFIQKGIMGISGQAGLAFFNSFEYGTRVVLNIGINASLGRKNHRAEIAMNTTLGYALRYGYRYQKPEGGFMGRIGFTHSVSSRELVKAEIYLFDLGIGWAF